MQTKKVHTFSWRSKNVQKRTKVDQKGMLCKSTLIESVCSNCVPLTHETNTLLKTNYARYRLVNYKNYWFSHKNTNVWKNAHCSIQLAMGEEPLYRVKKDA